MQTKSYRNFAASFSRLMACAVLLLAGSVTSVLGQMPVTNITLLAGDAAGTSSFTGATNWNNGLAPFSGNGLFTNAYFTTNFNLRTPAGGNPYTFAGDSLEVDSGGMGFKGYGTITVSNLILNGGKISNAGTGGSPDTALLAGNINVIASSSFDGGSTAGVTA
ncbi:MAG TPA: hypothetical protein VKJ65_14445, partial [Phycisphaerae bacterium]|nr:hypothetical protein [Phycisphaerae bacterium]